MRASLASKALSRSGRIPLPFRPLTRLAQNEECKCSGSGVGSRRGLGAGQASLSGIQRRSFMLILGAPQGRMQTQPCSLPWFASSSTKASSPKRRCRELWMTLGACCPKEIRLLCVRRFKLFVGSGRTSGSKVRQRKARRRDPEDRQHLCPRISDGGRRGAGDQRGDARARTFPKRMPCRLFVPDVS
jgi:hypothetical protein